MKLVWPEHPLAIVPRWAAFAVLLATLAACVWSIGALETRDTAQTTYMDQQIDRGASVDWDLYRIIDERVAAGESYYTAALDEHRSLGYPTRPFVTVRPPLLAWTTAVWGTTGWRMIAFGLWAANIFAWFAVLGGANSRMRQQAAALLAAGFGVIAALKSIPFSHEILAGLMLSLALALTQTRAWWAALAIAAFAIALRELAMPFLLAWGAVTTLDGRRSQALAIFCVVVLLGLGLALHAMAVSAARLPGDTSSPGWSAMIGLGLPLYGIVTTTPLLLMPNWLAGPLAVLPLAGWLGCGGRLGALATLWFAGFIAAVAIFARQENFYWMGLFVPAYGVGLVFVPRALRDLSGAIRRSGAPTRPKPASPVP